MPAWMILADDLTGACDTGAAFAARGRSTRVMLPTGAAAALPPDGSAVDVWVYSTESRALSPTEAARAVERVLRPLDLRGVRLYKKIDSTLRGHPAEELAALFNWINAGGLANHASCLVTPAFPAQGRTVVDGQVLVHGVPLAETAFAREVPQPDLARLFAELPGLTSLPLAEVRRGAAYLADQFARTGVFLADAQTEADLCGLAQAALASGLRLFCGSAGLAHALVEQIPAPQPLLPACPAIVSTGGAVLVAAGSRSAVTAGQVAYLRRQGTEVFSLAEVEADGFERLCDALSGGQSAVLSLAGRTYQPGGEQAAAEALAAVCAGVLVRQPLAGLVLTGGDTAAAVCRTLQSSGLDLGGEVRPGMVWSRLSAGPWQGLPVITKAGGFGDEMALADAVRFFHRA